MAIAATILTLVTWLFASRFAKHRVGLLAATFLAANPFTFALGRTGQHDMLLICFFAIALYSWYVGYSADQTWGYLGFFGAIALATLAKGPIALVLSGLILLSFLTWVGQLGSLWQMPWRWGGLLFGGILLPWYGLIVKINGWDYLSEFLGYTNVDRFLKPNLQQSAPGYFYLVLLPISFFPWNGLLPGLVLERLRWQWLRPEHWRLKARQNQLILFMTIWVVVVVSFMSVTAILARLIPGIPYTNSLETGYR